MLGEGACTLSWLCIRLSSSIFRYSDKNIPFFLPKKVFFDALELSNIVIRNENRRFPFCKNTDTRYTRI